MITKLAAAEKQIDTAIRLFFENRDHLSAYTLANASREITDDIIQQRKDEIFEAESARLGDPEKVRLSYREQFRDCIKPEFFECWLRLSRKRRNFLKHADRDPDGQMEDLTPKELALIILFAAWNLHLLGSKQSRERTTFAIWLGTAEPQLMKDSDHWFVGLVKDARASLQTVSAYDDHLFAKIYRSLSEATP